MKTDGGTIVAAAVLAADLIFNEGKITNTLLNKLLGEARIVKIVYVPVTEKELVDCSFGC